MQQRYHTTAHYLAILGLASNATSNDVKIAYRKLAKQFHPDRNASADAHQKFIEITEAYEMLTRTSAPFEKVYQTVNHKEEMRKKAREKATQAARMKYEAFLKSDYYRYTSALSYVIDVFILVFTLALTAFISSQFLVADNVTGAWVVVGVYVCCATLVIYIVTRNRKIQLRDYVNALRTFVGYQSTQQFICVLFSVVIFLSIGLLTLIPVDTILMSYLTLILAGVVMNRYNVKGLRKLWPYALPTCFSCLLCINYIFSNSAKTVSYTTEHVYNSYVLHFTRNELAEFAGARFFFDQSVVYETHTINYSFEDGLFGIKVVKQRQVMD